MATKQPNTICKNRDCAHGADGGRKHYYTCRYCVHSLNWRSVACSEECYWEYMKQIEAARKKSVEPDIYPERTDMPRSEVVELVESTDYEAAVKDTDQELAEELDENPGLGYADIVDQINHEIDKERGE